ncbi:ParB/Srx family N-terminal domain-containing protein [Oceanobacillus jordanicus]|uniref:ParB/Srx family N-terminal domain-containing protein n=1 Tax=Oceanobacillus jordanicus TaxID=2867266 RepID=A0AAW5B2Q6_9BACI|nr:ParB/Srx family N-terminal domain-containing protein [Oceanobacillus jordanicus]MCG3418228.1 ParB/Srx family N-terminal domain-containing protein [Oceanobacillus jordanicus]
MTKQLKKIKLSQIRLETSFRKSEKDLSLEMDISRQGLKVPLIVEEESENQFVLVDGYRRFYALEFIGLEDAYCDVVEHSSEEGRIVKRLGLELHTKKRTGYNLEEMIASLLESKKYDVSTIANLCNVTLATITKYVNGSEVNPEWLRRRKQTGAGFHALPVIHNLNVNDENKKYIADKYLGREIPKTTVDIIKKATEEKAFQDIPEEDVIECFEEIIVQKSRNYENVKDVVNEKALQAGYTKGSHTFVHNLILSLLTRVERIFKNNYYVQKLSKKQKSELTKKVRSLLMILDPPLTWAEFPIEEKIYKKPEKEDNGNLEH